MTLRKSEDLGFDRFNRARVNLRVNATCWVYVAVCCSTYGNGEASRRRSSAVLCACRVVVGNFYI